MNNKSQKELEFLNSLPQDAVKLLEVIDKIEVHTANLRNQIMSELRPCSNVIHLKLENIDN